MNDNSNSYDNSYDSFTIAIAMITAVIDNSNSYDNSYY